MALSPPVRPGFTLIETILVVLLTALVMGLLLPTLGNARASARDTVSVANMRSHAQVLAAYAADWDDYFPAFADPKATLSVVRGCDEVLVFRYFETVWAWRYALCEGYYNGALGHASFFHPAADPNRHPDDTKNLGISYLLSSAFLAAPAYWEPETRTGPSQWGHSRLSSASFPAQKALMTEVIPCGGFRFPAARMESASRSSTAARAGSPRPTSSSRIGTAKARGTGHGCRSASTGCTPSAAGTAGTETEPGTTSAADREAPAGTRVSKRARTAGDRGRTCTASRPRGPKPRASASSATPASIQILRPGGREAPFLAAGRPESKGGAFTTRGGALQAPSTTSLLLPLPSPIMPETPIGRSRQRHGPILRPSRPDLPRTTREVRPCDSETPSP